MSDGDAIDLIRSALAFDWLRVDAQPIVALSDGKFAAEELLVRVIDGDDSFIPPLAFIPTAERYGLMPMIDRYVIERAAGRAASGRAVHVNLSATTIAQEGLFDDIIGAIHRHGAPPGADHVRDHRDGGRRRPHGGEPPGHQARCARLPDRA